MATHEEVRSADGNLVPLRAFFSGRFAGLQNPRVEGGAAAADRALADVAGAREAEAGVLAAGAEDMEEDRCWIVAEYGTGPSLGQPVEKVHGLGDAAPDKELGLVDGAPREAVELLDACRLRTIRAVHQHHVRSSSGPLDPGRNRPKTDAALGK